MLRITSERRQHSLVLKLEGDLRDVWVEELRRCWHDAAAEGQAPLGVELTDVRFVDAAGKALLGEMYAAGTDLIATDILSAAIRAEIVAKVAAGRG